MNEFFHWCLDCLPKKVGEDDWRKERNKRKYPPQDDSLNTWRSADFVADAVTENVASVAVEGDRVLPARDPASAPTNVVAAKAQDKNEHTSFEFFQFLE